MKKFGRNSLAVGLVTLLVTAAASFSANGAQKTTYTSYAEAQFIASGGALGTLVDPLGDALEANDANQTSGAVACEGTEGCEGTNYTASPLQALDALLGPIGDALGGDVGPVGNYANAKDGASRAASGAVTNDGIINVGGVEPAPPANATLNLAGEGTPLSQLSALTNLRLEIGAVSSESSLASPTSAVVTDYNIAGAKLHLNVPLLKTVSDGIASNVGSALGDMNALGLDTLCEIPLIKDIPGLGDLLCSTLALQLNFPSLNDVFANVQDNLDDGVEINIDTGDVTVDLAKILQAANLDINNLPANADLTSHIVGALDDALGAVITDLTDTATGIVPFILNNSSIQIGTTTLDAGALGAALEGILDPLTNALNGLTGQLSDILPEVTGPNALGQLLSIRVNVPDAYRDLIAGQRGGVQPAATSGVHSQTGVRVQLLAAAGDPLADVMLANSVVGPNSATVVQVDDADTNADRDADVDADVNADADANADIDANADADANADQDADAISDADADANADAVADADANADADVATTLPNAGAPNLLPFWLLGAGLVLFGSAVLINERRRLNT